MKRGITLCGLILHSFICNGETIKWDGQAGDGLWSSALNWNTDQVPGITDDVILDNTFVPGDYTVTLPSGNILISLLSLTIQPAFSVIQCVLPVTNVASPALLLSGNGDAFILHEGAVFRNASGAGTGTPVTVSSGGFFRINNGGHYIHQTARGHTDFLVSRLSTAPGTENGVFEFDVPGTAAYTVSVSGRTFGRLVFSATSAGAARTYTGAGINPVLIRGGLIIAANTIFSYGANTDTITVRGNSLIQSGGVFNIANGSNSSVIRFEGNLENHGLITETGTSTGSSLIMNGSNTQAIACAGNISQQVTMIMDNEAGLTLVTPLHLPYGLSLRRGKIYSTATNLLSLGAGAFCSGGSEQSFVQGPVKKTGSTAFSFPVGTGGIYAPLTLGAGGVGTDEFIAEYKRANPQSTSGLGNVCAYPINHISYVEYWNMIRVSGDAPRQIGLSVSPFSFAYDLEALVVARADNGQWVSEGGVDHLAGTPQLPYVTGSFVSIDGVQSFGAFTLGSLINQAQNPLPVPVEYFTAKLTDGNVQLSWRTGICPAEKIRTELSFSTYDRIFRDLVIANGSDTSCRRDLLHKPLSKGPHYYRLRLKDEQGEFIFSKEILVMIDGSALTPAYYVKAVHAVDNGVRILAKLPEGNSQFLIVDGLGRTICLREHYTSGKQERIDLPVHCPVNGLYRLMVVAGKERFSSAFVR